MTVRKRRGVAVMAGRLRENRNRPARGNRHSRALSPQRLAYAALSFPRAFTTTPHIRQPSFPRRRESSICLIPVPCFPSRREGVPLPLAMTSAKGATQTEPQQCTTDIYYFFKLCIFPVILTAAKALLKYPKPDYNKLILIYIHFFRKHILAPLLRQRFCRTLQLYRVLYV